MNGVNEIETLCEDGEALAKIITRFRERVAKGMKFDEVLALLERADKTLAVQMNLVADFMDVEIDKIANEVT